MTIRFISISYNESVVLHRQSFSRRLAVLLFYKPSEAEHQGTFTDGNHKLQKLIFMITIENLVEQGANIKIEVTPTDLKMFAESIVQRILVAYDESEREQIVHRKNDETYYNTKQVREMFNVCDTTLNLWAKRGYLVPVKFGNRNMYTKTDIDRIRTGNRAETVSAYCRKKQVQP